MPLGHSFRTVPEKRPTSSCHDCFNKIGVLKIASSTLAERTTRTITASPPTRHRFIEDTMNAQAYYQQGKAPQAASQNVQSVNMASLMLQPGQQQIDAKMFIIPHSNDSPAASPTESKGSPASSSSSMDDQYSHWDLSFASMADGECLACGYRYGSVEELADHQRIDHGLADVIF